VLKPVLRVGFAPHLHEGWLGGINYIRNLFSAISASRFQERRIEPVLLVRKAEAKAAEALKDYAPIIEVPAILARISRLPVAGTPMSWLLWWRFLRRNNIELLSHSPLLLPRRTMPSLGMLYDFQHRHLPDFFSEQERHSRDRDFLEMARGSTLIVVSSNAALEDLKTYIPECAHKGRVLKFVANTGITAPTPQHILRNRYHMPEVYVYLPNQFWKHKNHSIVLQALRILKDQNKDVTILASGAASDYRHPGYFPELMRQAQILGVSSCFRVLGVVPYEDLLGLVRASAAVLNPSLFEGWSTTVEEAKSMGKLTLLSGIPTHVEQAPERCMYFDPRSAEELSACLIAAVSSFSSTDEAKWMGVAHSELNARMQNYAMAYEALALEALQQTQPHIVV
jgi:glycosyltransferase involved in cell wall biosynthesis